MERRGEIAASYICARVWCVASERTHGRGRARDALCVCTRMTVLFLPIARECVFSVLIKVGLNDSWLSHYYYTKLKKKREFTKRTY